METEREERTLPLTVTKPHPIRFRGNLKDPRGARADQNKLCPINDPNCIADHLESDYCIYGHSPDPTEAVPEAPEGVGAPVISSGHPDTPEIVLEDPAVDNPTITILPPKAQNFLLPEEHSQPVGTDLNMNGRPITITATEKRGDDMFHEYEYLTPVKYAQRWTKNWINFDLGVTPIAERTGRRADRKDKLVKSFTKPVRYPFARGCGHKFVELQQPTHRNCEVCWNAFFWNQNELTENIARNIQEQGPEIVQAIHGKDFLKHFLRFAILLARYEQFRQQQGTECAAVEEEKDGSQQHQTTD